MGRRRRGYWMATCFQIVTTILTLIGIVFVANNDQVGATTNNSPQEQESTPPLKNTHVTTKKAGGQLPPKEHFTKPPMKSGDANCDIFYIIVSTIDGKLSALDLHKQGTLAWSLGADSKPLYSSSLANMEMIHNGKKMRVIPSLDGALYQFDGEKVEAVPMSAETLLSSTYRLSDDSMVVGSKDLRNYGIDFKTGEIQFTCGSDGCSNNKGEAKKDSLVSNNILVLSRTTQVVRSVDIMSGSEKWNFSVGQHQLNMPKAVKQERIEDMEDGDFDEDLEEPERIKKKESVPLFTRLPNDECPPKKFPENVDFEDYLRLIVPEGKVVALDKDDAAGIRWEYKFDSPIAKAWILRNGKVEPMSLFDGRHVPTLGTFQPEDLENESMHQPLLYIGSHEKQLYIQPSPQMENVLKSFPNKRAGHVVDSKVKVSWRPYLNTASVRTPILNGNRPIPASKKPQKPSATDDTQALSVWHEDYPFDTGYFLYPEFRDTRNPKKMDVLLIEHFEREDEQGIMNLPASLWFHWKEIIAISTITSLVVLMVTKFLGPNLNPVTLSVQVSDSSKNSNSDSIQNTNDTDKKPQSGDLGPSGEAFISRFATDFKVLSCLGKGGFGIVFEAERVLEDQRYAVKRIQLPRGEDAKEKVRREVKEALSKLEHINVVRYYSCWEETPPPGWQEQFDEQVMASESSDTTSYSLQHSISRNTSPSVSPRSILKQKSLSKLSQILPDITAEASLGNDSVVFEDSADNLLQCNKANSGSGEFSFHPNLEDTGDEDSSSENMSLKGNSIFKLDSFSSNAPSEDSNVTNTQSSIPFSTYSSPCSSKQTNYLDDLTDDSVVFQRSNNDVTDDSVIFERTHNDVTDDSVVFERTNGAIKDVSDRKKLSFKNNNCDTSGIHNGNNDTPILDRDHTVDILSSRDGTLDRDNEKITGTGLSLVGNKSFLYIQTQLCQKDTLKEWLSNNTLNRDRHTVLDIFDQILCAIDYVHSCGLMHRDLKPSNIFFSNDGVVKVGDFGLVTKLGVEQDEEIQTNNSQKSARHTAEVGTTLYMSPEQISKKPYDFKVDVFSLGLILLELWIPFGTQMERIRTLQDAKRQHFPSNFIRELPVECELVKHMTSADPSLRPATQYILDHPLLKDFAPTRIMTMRKGRARTISENSPPK